MNRSVWAIWRAWLRGGRLELRRAAPPGPRRTRRTRRRTRRRPPAQLEHVGGDGVDEVAVVADEQQPAAPGHQVLLEPGDGVDVEVVGGLVEHQQVGPGEQQAGQGDPHPPAARELLDGAGGVVVVEARGRRGRAAPRRRARSRPAARSGSGPRRRRRAACRASGPSASARRWARSLEPVGELGDVPGAGEHLVEDGAVLGGVQLLGQVADAQVLGAVHLALVGLLHADEDLEQRGLAERRCRRRAPGGDPARGEGTRR